MAEDVLRRVRRPGAAIRPLPLHLPVLSGHTARWRKLPKLLIKRLDSFLGSREEPVQDVGRVLLSGGWHRERQLRRWRGCVERCKSSISSLAALRARNGLLKARSSKQKRNCRCRRLSRDEAQCCGQSQLAVAAGAGRPLLHLWPLLIRSHRGPCVSRTKMRLARRPILPLHRHKRSTCNH